VAGKKRKQRLPTSMRPKITTMGSKWTNAIFRATKLLAHNKVAAIKLTNGNHSDFSFTAFPFGARRDPLVKINPLPLCPGVHPVHFISGGDG
jgi:hypothetical protein